jgi:Protein of unknown function (DUF3572)
VNNDTPTDPYALALAALAATLDDPRRARRFLDLTGIGTDELRARADEPSLLIALIAFLEAHEPDLISVSEQVGIGPATLAAVRQQLENR